MRFGGGRWDGGDWSFDDWCRKGLSRNVLNLYVFSKMVSKVLVDKGVLGERGEEVFLIVEAVVVLEGGDVGEEFEIVGGGRRDRGASDNICRRGRVVGVVAKGKSGPDGRFRWGGGEGLGNSGDEDGGEEGGVVENRGRRVGDGNDG